MAKDAPTLQGRDRRVVLAPRPPTTARAVPASAPTTNAPPRAVRIERGGQDAVELALDAGARYVVGRHDAADIGFDADEVSRVHGVLRADEHGWSYEDLGSSNGTTLTRAGVTTPVAAHAVVVLHADDVLELGSADARLVLQERVAPEDAAPGDRTARSEVARRFRDRVRMAARTRVPVFLLGPSGTGKTHTAREIHEASGAKGPFVAINCARLPTDASSLHSELLGHVRGAFTGADAPRTGKLFLADGGTLFLDEVESLAPVGQGFLLDVLEGTGDLSPLGARSVHVSPPIFRLISASKIPLGDSGLRPDLAERLAEGHMWRMPLLHERTSDIPGLIDVFVALQEKLLGVHIDVAPSFVRAAIAAPWPGQIRQLKACVNVLAQSRLAELLDDPRAERRIALTRDALDAYLEERALAFASPAEASSPRTKVDPRSLTRAHLEEILAAVDGNQSEAARRLKISRNTLAKKLRALTGD